MTAKILSAASSESILPVLRAHPTLSYKFTKSTQPIHSWGWGQSLQALHAGDRGSFTGVPETGDSLVFVALHFGQIGNAICTVVSPGPKRKRGLCLHLCPGSHSPCKLKGNGR